MREHNAGADSNRKVSFYGLDAGFNDNGRESVRSYLARLAPERLSVIDPIFVALRTQERGGLWRPTRMCS